MEENIQETNIPIQLFAACSTKGDFTPIWFRFESAEHMIEKVTISKIFSHKEINFVGIKMIQYICGATVAGCERIFEIRYNVSSHKWILFKVLS